MESHGSQDTKYPGIPRTVPGSPTRVVLIRKNTHIPQYLVFQDIVDVPGLSLVLVRKNIHTLQYLESRDDPELSKSSIENKQYSCSNIVIGDTL